MKENTVGNILYKLRSEAEASQEQLCYGLCSVSALSKYESGERLPDRLLLNVLLQRLGKSAYNMETVLSAEEYQYFEERKALLATIVNQDKKAFCRLLKEQGGEEVLSESRTKYLINETLQKQFLYCMLAIRAKWIENDIKEGISLLRQGIELTLPGLPDGKYSGFLISVEELLMILQYAKLFLQDAREREAEEILRIVILYAEVHFQDAKMKAQIYPKAVKLLIPVLEKQEKYAECMGFCERAIALLSHTGILHDLTELLEGYLDCCMYVRPTEKARKYKKLLESLNQLYQEYEVEYGNSSLYMNYSSREMYLINEIISLTRRSRRMTQEKLCEDICTPETISRIESGKRSPSTKNFYRLMERLELERDYYHFELDTSDYEVQEKYYAFGRMMTLRRWEDARPLLEEVKNQLNMENRINRFVIEVDENMLSFHEGKLDLDSFLHACEKALCCENEEWKEEAYWNQFLTRTKVVLFSHLASTYGWKGRHEDALFLFRKTLEELEKSSVALEDRFSSVAPIIANLSTEYGKASMMQECVEMCRKGILMSLKKRKSTLLPMFLSNMAEALEAINPENVSICKKYVHWAYYLSDFEKNERINKYADAFYRARYDADIRWY